MNKKILSLVLTGILTITSATAVVTPAKVNDVNVTNKIETKKQEDLYVKTVRETYLMSRSNSTLVKVPANTKLKFISVSGKETNGIAIVEYTYRGVKGNYAVSTRNVTPVNFIWIY